MPEKVPILVVGGLTAGTLLIAGVLLYRWRQSVTNTNSNMIIVDKQKYSDLMESLFCTKKEIELAMENMIINTTDNNNTLLPNDALYKSLKTSLHNLQKCITNPNTLMSDTEEFETPPSGSLNMMNNFESVGYDDTEWLYINDGYHTQYNHDIWKIYIEKNSNLDYYITCAMEYARTPIIIRKFRTTMLNLQDDVDYIVKVIALRGAFDLLLDNLSHVNWLIDTLRSCFCEILEIANKSTTQFDTAFDDFLSYALDSKNSEKTAKELSDENIGEINVYDIVIDYMILDSLSDLNCLPSAILSVTKSRFISRSLKENAFCTLVWSYIQNKVKKLKNQSGFLAKYYNLCHTISPVLAWGFLGDTGPLNEACNSFKDTFMKFIIKIFDENKVLYENKFDLADGVIKSAKKAHKSLMKRFESLKELQTTI